MATGRPFAVDLDELGRLLAAMAACRAELDGLGDEVARRVRGLHATWSGRAAAAQDAAQRSWDAGFAEMREGLATMRLAGVTAYDNYAAAASTNVEMWRRLQ